MNTSELTDTIRERLTSGESLDDLLAQLSQSIVQLHARLGSADPDERHQAMVDGLRLQEEIAELTTLGENRMTGLHMEVTAITRKGSLDRLYGLIPDLNPWP